MKTSIDTIMGYTAKTNPNNPEKLKELANAMTNAIAVPWGNLLVTTLASWTSGFEEVEAKYKASLEAKKAEEIAKEAEKEVPLSKKEAHVAASAEEMDPADKNREMINASLNRQLKKLKQESTTASASDGGGGVIEDVNLLRNMASFVKPQVTSTIIQ